MNRCRVCGKECKGNTCSGSCRARLSRRTRTRTRTPEASARALISDKSASELACTPTSPDVKIDKPQIKPQATSSSRPIAKHRPDKYKQGADSLDTHHSRFIANGGKDNVLARATYTQLMTAIHRYKADAWVGSPESVELNKRLMTWPKDRLKGYWIPARIWSGWLNG